MGLAWLILFLLLLGALLFSAVGYFAALLRLQTQPPLRTNPNADESHSRELSALHETHSRELSALHETHSRELSALQKQLALSHTQQDTHNKTHQTQQQEIQQLTETLRTTQRALQQEQERVSRFQESATHIASPNDAFLRLQAKTTSLEQQNAELLAQQKDQQNKYKELEQQLFGLRQYINSLSDETVPLKDFKKIEQLKVAREVECLQLQQRILELEEKAFQKTYLEQKIQDYNKIHDESERMKKKIAELEAQLFFFHFRESQKKTHPLPKLNLLDNQPRDKIATSYIARWKAQKRYAAVVADSLGFPLLYDGKEDMEEWMPICSALLQEIGEKIVHYLPIGKLLAIDLYTEQEHCLRSRYLDCNGESLSLLFLEQHPLPTQPETDELLQQLQSLLSFTESKNL